MEGAHGLYVIAAGRDSSTVLVDARDPRRAVSRIGGEAEESEGVVLVRTRCVIVTVVLVATAGCGKSSETNAGNGAGVPPVRLAGVVTNHGQADLGASPSGRRTLALEQDDFYFNPTFIKAPAGQSIAVTLKNEGKATHTFTIDSMSIDEQLPPDTTKVVTVMMPGAGAVNFYCRFHRSRGMQGALYTRESAVEGSGSTRSNPRTTASVATTGGSGY
jgi:plastocyanin